MKKQELGLIVKKESKINKIVNRIRMLVFLDDMKLLKDLEKLTYIRKRNINKIIIPVPMKTEVKLGKRK